MKKLVRIAAAVLFIAFAAGKTFAEEPAAPTAQEPSIGTQAGEGARHFKENAQTTLQRARESFQTMMANLQKEWDKFMEAYNKPAQS